MATSTTMPETHPRTREPLRPLGFRRDGRPIWPILGGDDSDDAAKAAAEKAAADKAAADKATAAAKTVEPKGFPEGTPLEQMTVEQQANYWKHQARKHEDRVKAFGGLTPEQLTQLREKAEKHDKLEYDLASDHEKAVTDARTAAAAAAAAMFVPQIVNAQLDAAAARKGVSGEALAKALEFVDHEKFLNDDGAIDAAKVQSFVDGIAPAKGTQPKGPSLTGHSAGGGSGRGSSVAAGREMWAERHKKTTTS